MPVIEINELSKRYGKTKAVNNISGIDPRIRQGFGRAIQNVIDISIKLFIKEP